MLLPLKSKFMYLENTSKYLSPKSDRVILQIVSGSSELPKFRNINIVENTSQFYLVIERSAIYVTELSKQSSILYLFNKIKIFEFFMFIMLNMECDLMKSITQTF